MCSMSVLCPLCAQTSFTSIDALRNSLIKVANGPLPCPICNEKFLGLDKLTIHLFSHTDLVTNAETAAAATEKTQNFCEAKITSKTSKSPTQRDMTKNLTITNEMGSTDRKLNKKSKEKKGAVINNDKDNAVVVKMQQQQETLKISPNSMSNSTNELGQLSSCDICEFTFRNEQLRDMHINLVHQNLSNSSNITNQQAFIYDSPTATTVIEHDFKCHLCSKTYKTKGSLRVHLKVVHMLGLANNANKNSTKFNICDRIRHKEAKIQKTVTQQFPNNKQSPCQTTLLLQSPAIDTTAIAQSSPQFQDLMLLTTTQQVKTENHLVMSTQQIHGNPMQSFDPDSLNSNLLLVYTPQGGESNKDSLNKPAADNPKIWECDVCSKSFTTKYFLKKHKRLHTGEMPYTCEICARTFTFQQSYHKHLLYHSDEKPHICATCGRAFKEVSTLHNHERIHSGEKPFNCEICGKCFRQRVSFLVHSRIHTGVMPYKCEECQKNFRYKVSLRTHKCVRAGDKSTETLENVQHQTNSSQLQNNTTSHQQTPNEPVSNIFSNQNSPDSIEIALINNATNILDTSCVEALLSKSIDDIVVESCKKMGIGNENDDLKNPTNTVNMANINSPQVRLVTSPATLNDCNEGSSSPLQKLQEMRLYSPKFDMEATANDNSSEFVQMLFK